MGAAWRWPRGCRRGPTRATVVLSTATSAATTWSRERHRADDQRRPARGAGRPRGPFLDDGPERDQLRHQRRHRAPVDAHQGGELGAGQRAGDVQVLHEALRGRDGAVRRGAGPRSRPGPPAGAPGRRPAWRPPPSGGYRPVAAARRRAIASTLAASRRTRAGDDELHAGLLGESGRPLSMTAMTRPPRTASMIRPLPPNSEVPPMTAAATASSSVFAPPVCGRDGAQRDGEQDAADGRQRGADDEARRCLMLPTLMPARRAASALPPTA